MDQLLIMFCFPLQRGRRTVWTTGSWHEIIGGQNWGQPGDSPRNGRIPPDVEADTGQFGFRSGRLGDWLGWCNKTAGAVGRSAERQVIFGTDSSKRLKILLLTLLITKILSNILNKTSSPVDRLRKILKIFSRFL